jgi:hypothetical protein
MEINLFRSLFKGRDDVFAIRWEKENKSGYSPAYSYDPYYYKRHRMAGGTFQNYTDKSYLPLSDNEVKKHLEGQQHIGVYPLLADNTIKIRIEELSFIYGRVVFVYNITEMHQQLEFHIDNLELRPNWRY